MICSRIEEVCMYSHHLIVNLFSFQGRDVGIPQHNCRIIDTFIDVINAILQL